MSEGLRETVMLVTAAVGVPLVAFVWWKMVARGTGFVGFLIFHVITFAGFGATTLLAEGPTPMSVADWVWALCSLGAASLLAANSSERVARAAEG